MSGPVPDIPATSELARLRPGEPLFGTSLLSLDEKLVWLLARCVESVASCSMVPYSLGSTLETRIAYAPSPGAQALYIEIQPNTINSLGSSLGKTITFTVDLTVGALNGGAWIGPTPLDGDNIRLPIANLTQQPSYTGLVDLTGVSKGIASEPTIKITSTELAPFRILIAEIPLPTYAPAADPDEEIGVDPASFAGGAPVVDGGSPYSQGFYRLIDQMSKARNQVRRHLQFFHFQQTGSNSHFRCTDKTNFKDLIDANSTATGSNTPTTFEFYCRARRLYTTATANKYKLVVRYNVGGSGGNCTFRCVVTPAGGSPTNTDNTLTDTSGAWATFVSSGTVDLPTSGTDQIVAVRFQGKVANVGTTLDIAMVALIESED